MNKLKKQRTLHTASIIGEVFGLILSLIFLYVIFPRLSFIQQDYYLWQLIGVWAAIVSAFFNIMKRLTSIYAYQKLFEVFSLMITLYSTYVLFTIFPIDLEVVGYKELEPMIKFAMQAVILALGIAILVNFASLLFSKEREN